MRKMPAAWPYGRAAYKKTREFSAIAGAAILSFGIMWWYAGSIFATDAPRYGVHGSDAEIRQAIIRHSIAQYQATGHPCACPYNSMRNGRSCGDRSAYSRPGGASPLCYANDVTDRMVADWRR